MSKFDKTTETPADEIPNSPEAQNLAPQEVSQDAFKMNLSKIVKPPAGPFKIDFGTREILRGFSCGERTARDSLSLLQMGAAGTGTGFEEFLAKKVAELEKIGNDVRNAQGNHTLAMNSKAAA